MLEDDKMQQTELPEAWLLVFMASNILVLTRLYILSICRIMDL